MDKKNPHDFFRTYVWTLFAVISFYNENDSSSRSLGTKCTKKTKYFSSVDNSFFPSFTALDLPSSHSSLRQSFTWRKTQCNDPKMLRTKTINTTLHLQKEMKRKFTSCNIASTPPLLKMYSRKYILKAYATIYMFLSSVFLTPFVLFWGGVWNIMWGNSIQANYEELMLKKQVIKKMWDY